MTTMVRKQVYITTYQDALLKRLARRLGVSEAELIRRAIDHDLGAGQGTTQWLRPEAWEEERAFRASWLAQHPTQKVQRWTREELYEERLDRNGDARLR